MNRRKSAEVLATDTPRRFAAAVRQAAEALRRGELVAVPTETVYGLAANALDPEAVQSIFEAKGRPAHNPVIVHVAGLDQARRCAREWPALADRLASAFWPGPLTLVVRRSRDIPDAVTSGGDTVGVRWPGHPFIQALIRECGFPLAAPSANRSNEVSPTNAAHVIKSLGHRVRWVVDGGSCQVGIESTVLDVTSTPPRVLRAGMIHDPSLRAVTGALASGADATPGPPRSPGMIEKHYAPRAPLSVLAWRDEADLRRQVAGTPGGVEGIHVIAHTNIPSGFGQVSVIPHDPEAFARALYAELHRCNDAGARRIVVEAVPDAPEWRAIADRLRRAAA